jgi:hypothetical protein
MMINLILKILAWAIALFSALFYYVFMYCVFSIAYYFLFPENDQNDMYLLVMTNTTILLVILHKNYLKAIYNDK